MQEMRDPDRDFVDPPQSPGRRNPVRRWREERPATGMGDLPGLLPAAALAEPVAGAGSPAGAVCGRRARRHDSHVREDPPLPADQPVLVAAGTASGRVCAGRMPGPALPRLHGRGPLALFPAAASAGERQLPVADPPARAKVIRRAPGAGADRHRDGSGFAATLRAPAPEAGGRIGDRRDLHSAAEPNRDGVAHLPRGEGSGGGRVAAGAGPPGPVRPARSAAATPPVASGRSRGGGRPRSRCSPASAGRA